MRLQKILGALALSATVVFGVDVADIPELGMQEETKVIEQKVYKFDGFDTEFSGKERLYEGKVPGTNKTYSKKVEEFKSVDGKVKISKQEDGSIKVTKSHDIDLAGVAVSGESMLMNGNAYKVRKTALNKDGSTRVYIKGGYVDMKDGKAVKASYKTTSKYKSKVAAQ